MLIWLFTPHFPFLRLIGIAQSNDYARGYTHMYISIYDKVKNKIFLTSPWVSKTFVLALDSIQDTGIEFLLHKNSYISVTTLSPNPHFYVVERFPVSQSSEAASRSLLLTSVLNGIYPFDFHFAQAVSLVESKSWCHSCIIPIWKKQHGHFAGWMVNFPLTLKGILFLIFLSFIWFLKKGKFPESFP